MNVIHITVGKVNPIGDNGINRVVYYLNKYEKINGLNSQIWSFTDEVNKETNFERDQYVAVKLFPFISIFNIFNGILKKIIKERNHIDLVHFHIPWIKEKYFLSKILNILNIPYVITCHGLYHEEFIASLKKKIAFILYERNILNRALIIRALTYEEKYNCRKIGVYAPVFVSPNGIDEAEIPTTSSKDFFELSPYKNKIKILWVGVLRDYKNIDGLIRSTAYLPKSLKSQIQFVIVGPDSSGNLNKLKKLCADLCCTDNFDFHGPLYGQSKYEAINSSDIYIMPSHIDEISLAVMDAMACGKPCVLTRQCHVSYFYNENFFLMCEPYPEDIARAIEMMVDMRDDWALMGNNAKKLIAEYFSWKRSVPIAIKKYNEMLSNG